jgi:AraC family transcriptional regulator
MKPSAKAVRRSSWSSRAARGRSTAQGRAQGRHNRGAVRGATISSADVGPVGTLLASAVASSEEASPPLQPFTLQAATRKVRFDERSDLDPSRLSNGDATSDLIYPVVGISPPEVATRCTVTGHGMAAESVQCAGRNKIQYRFRAPVHLLVMYEKGERRNGETFVEGLPRSTLRSLERKLTFVPAGHEYHEWHEPRGHTRIMLFYFDPAKLKIDLELGMPDVSLGPRLLFEDATLWQTALKLKSLVDSLASGDRLYFETLGSLLVHELVRLSRGIPSIQPRVRGGLTPWQQRIITAYIEKHVNERIPLATLAHLVRLSPCHFSRVFKQSLGMPPYRYQTDRRMEHAKLLLAEHAVSVTEIGLTIGFSSPNAFATAFRKATGLAPTDYRRSLAPAMTA